MRTFCTEGPIEKERNYFVPRAELVAEGLRKVDEWRYFTIFAPRQSGKSTYFRFLIDEIRAACPEWLPIWVSFEDVGDMREGDFLRHFGRLVAEELDRMGGKTSPKGPPEAMSGLADWFRDLAERSASDVVLIIDEIEGLRNVETLNAFLHAVRRIYHKKELYRLRSVILTGVSNITGILQDSASPFNIADQLDVPYFTFEETKDLLSQHTAATGQKFDPDVVREIFANTAGQPGLTNALARDLVEKKCPGMRDVTPVDFYRSLDDFTRVYFDKNMRNVANKAKQYPELMKRILFDGPVEFTTYDERIAFLAANGILVRDERNACTVPVPMYEKCLYTTFKPLVNGETRHFKDPFESVRDYLSAEGVLNMEKILDRYASYIRYRLRSCS